MAARKATSSGKWSQSIWDVTPSAGDNVFANGFTIEIDQNINVSSLQTTLSTGYVDIGGGTFNVFQPHIINVSPNGIVAGTTACLTVQTSGFGSTEVIGPVFGGSAASAYGISNLGPGMVSISGSVIGGSDAAAFGVYNASLGTISQVGDSTGGSAATAIRQNSTGTVLITGTITASPNAHGVTSSSADARNEFTGTLVNSDGCRQAVYCAKYLLRPKTFDSSTIHKNTELVNILTYSEQFNIYPPWYVVGNVTVTPNVTSSPFGEQTADKILETTANAQHNIYETITIKALNIPVALSVYLKPIGRRYTALTVQDGSNGFSVMFDLSGSGSMSSSKIKGTGSLSTSAISAVTDGWYRCSVAGIPSTGGAVSIFSQIVLSDRSDYSGALASSIHPSYLGVSLSGVYAWGAQLEYGSTATNYVSAEASQGYSNISAHPVSFYAPEAYIDSYVPHVSSVSFGTAYAAVSSLSGTVVGIPVQLTGTMRIPSVASVSLGTLVGIASGSAIHSPEHLQQIWDTNIDILTIPNSLGARLKNSATIQEVGQQIQNLNI